MLSVQCYTRTCSHLPSLHKGNIPSHQGSHVIPENQHSHRVCPSRNWQLKFAYTQFCDVEFVFMLTETIDVACDSGEQVEHLVRLRLTNPGS